MSSFGKSVAIIDHEGLKCPECGDNWLHQGNTTIFERSEDDSYTTVIAQNEHEVNASKFPSADTCNPSPRRHGIIIEFSCEHCHYIYDSQSDEVSQEKGDLFRLAILQHKGNTFIEWL